MIIRNRLFNYPVLCGDTDDYSSDTQLILLPKITDNTHELILCVEYDLRCDALEALIRNGSADFVLHIECGTTAFRIALKSAAPRIEYRLPKSRVNGEIALVAMIVAKKDILHYSSTDLNEDYLGERISFEKGAILAYQNLPSIYVSKKTEELANNESFFTVIKQVGLDPNENKPLTFNLYGDKIQILVDEKTYEAFIRYQHSKSIAMAMLVMPALTFMIHEASEQPDSFRSYLWFQRLDKFYHSQGINFVDDILRKDDNPVNIAQEMLQNPVGNAYRELFALEE